MPHLRERYLKPLISKTMSLSSIVGIVGHRQSGKTTLITELTTNYITLDNKQNRIHAQENPDQFLLDHEKRNTMLAIDETQLAPDLFPALKDSVRLNKKPGNSSRGEKRN